MPVAPLTAEPSSFPLRCKGAPLGSRGAQGHLVAPAWRPGMSCLARGHLAVWGWPEFPTAFPSLGGGCCLLICAENHTAAIAGGPAPRGCARLHRLSGTHGWGPPPACGAENEVKTVWACAPFHVTSSRSSLSARTREREFGESNLSIFLPDRKCRRAVWVIPYVDTDTEIGPCAHMNTQDRLAHRR